MQLLATEMPRVFRFKLKDEVITLSDIGADQSPEDVLNFYANTYPVLTTAKIMGPKFEDDAVVYKFLPTLGTKG